MQGAFGYNAAGEGETGRIVEQQAAAALLLYVEDEVLLQEVLSVALAEAGYEVLTVATGDEGVEVLKSRSGEIRGLITDINLGPGLDGWAVAQQARELISGLPVVYVSGASHQDWTSKGVPESMMIIKPFAPAQIVVAISGLLNKAGHPDGSTP